MNEDLNNGQLGEGDDRPDEAPTAERPNEEAAEDCPTTDAEPQPENGQSDASDDPEAACEALRQTISQAVEDSKTSPEARSAALIDALARECCSQSDSTMNAIEIGSSMITGFKARVGSIVGSADYQKPSGLKERVVEIPLDAATSAMLLGALSRSVRI